MAKSDQPPADDRVYDIGGFEAELFWEKNRSIILVCVGLALVASSGAGDLVYQSSQPTPGCGCLLRPSPGSGCLARGD